MKKKQQKTDEAITNAPDEKEFSIATGLNSKHPLGSDAYAPGDSVDEHKNLESANLYLDEGEISQQNNNL
ncbi:hypothetical protein M1K46_06525 [Fictibacillus sp. WQ 8-8]|uniref:Uncharacterized protein n=1 Tax=Fictibacillus marinisediminis TaxID=2878389 RepID=A0A9X1X966_9BACL|nr:MULTISPECIES: hypothetical protein [Fictibacillus]MCK6256522.1 hypothetical protein [Fictibacillus marinisediminis]MCQ6265314.1 hypothetical protein [Fictibacillus sp. WQ 8-8]